MSLENLLQTRANHHCELCQGTDALAVFVVAPKSGDDENDCALLCSVCRDQLNSSGDANINHWRCLAESMWSTVAAVQVLAWRQLKALADEGWPQDLLDQLYLDEETQRWAETVAVDDAVVHRDCHGAILQAGDTVTLIKDLDVKGANFTAKRGTAVRSIGLVADNAEHIEGRVNGQRIVILTQYVKKSG